jgi:hypothetical protein
MSGNAGTFADDSRATLWRLQLTPERFKTRIRSPRLSQQCIAIKQRVRLASRRRRKQARGSIIKGILSKGQRCQHSKFPLTRTAPDTQEVSPGGLRPPPAKVRARSENREKTGIELNGIIRLLCGNYSFGFQSGHCAYGSRKTVHK